MRFISQMSDAEIARHVSEDVDPSSFLFTHSSGSRSRVWQGRIMAAGMVSPNPKTALLTLDKLKEFGCSSKSPLVLMDEHMRYALARTLVGLARHADNDEVRTQAYDTMRQWIREDIMPEVPIDDITVPHGFFYRSSAKQRPRFNNKHSLENHSSHVWVGPEGDLIVKAGCLRGTVAYAAERWFKAELKDASPGSSSYEYRYHRNHTKLVDMMYGVAQLAAANKGKARLEARALYEMLQQRDKTRLSGSWYRRHSELLTDLMRAGLGLPMQHQQQRRPRRPQGITRKQAIDGMPVLYLVNP